VTNSQVSEAPRRCKNVCNEDRMTIFSVLLGMSAEGNYKRDN